MLIIQALKAELKGGGKDSRTNSNSEDYSYSDEGDSDGTS